MTKLRLAVKGLRRRLGQLLGATEWDQMRSAIGALAAREARSAASMREAEFRGYSQFGEDGIIQWLIARVPIHSETFIEFGVGDYRESNTRFLLEHDSWRGLILDSGSAHLAYLAGTNLSWRYSIDARSAFVTRDNINDLLTEMAGDVGLLSIDIDGNDYWVWEALSAVSPRIVVIEYNANFGHDRPVVVPYDEAFDRSRAHYSWLYFGASLAALCRLGAAKGYRFVGSNSTGHNAFFVREDVAGDLPALAPADGWRESRFRESRDVAGRMSYVGSHAERRSLIADMPLIDVETGEQLVVGDLS
jgi:hypothetical protein